MYFPLGVILTFCFAARQRMAIEIIVLGSALFTSVAIEAGHSGCRDSPHARRDTRLPAAHLDYPANAIRPGQNGSQGPRSRDGHAVDGLDRNLVKGVDHIGAAVELDVVLRGA